MSPYRHFGATRSKAWYAKEEWVMRRQQKTCSRHAQNGMWNVSSS